MIIKDAYAPKLLFDVCLIESLVGREAYDHVSLCSMSSSLAVILCWINVYCQASILATAISTKEA